MILSLDTSEIVAALRDPSMAARRAFDETRKRGVPLVVSAVAVHELMSGAATSARPLVQLDLLETYLGDVEQIDFTADDARASGALWARLRAAGMPIGDLDTLIAGQALARRWTVVTRNVKHFGRVDGLPLIDWSVGPDPLSAEAVASRVGAAG